MILGETPRPWRGAPSVILMGIMMLPWLLVLKICQLFGLKIAQDPWSAFDFLRFWVLFGIGSFVLHVPFWLGTLPLPLTQSLCLLYGIGCLVWIISRYEY